MYEDYDRKIQVLSVLFLIVVSVWFFLAIPVSANKRYDILKIPHKQIGGDAWVEYNTCNNGYELMLWQLCLPEVYKMYPERKKGYISYDILKYTPPYSEIPCVKQIAIECHTDTTWDWLMGNETSRMIDLRKNR